MKHFIPPFYVAKRHLLTLFLSLFALSCIAQDKSQTIQVGPEAKADLLIYFKSDVSNEEINEFISKHVMRPSINNKGFRNPDGVQIFSRIFPPVQGHEGIALKFFQNAPQEKKEALKKALETSPLVYVIIENMAPLDVKSLDGYSTEGHAKESRKP